jgi:macrolide phosphotransferase
LRIGDPADDFAWLVASNEQDFVDAVLDAYTASRRDTPDSHLLRRAALSAEFALAQYLVKGIASVDSAMISEAEEMLGTLARDIEEYGGQPISVEPQPAAAAPAIGGTAAVAPADGTEPVVRAADAGPTGSLPSVTVVPLPVPAPVQPAVHVTPIPVERGADAASGEAAVEGGAADDNGGDRGQEEPATAEAAAGPDDTSTAAISIIEPAKNQGSR